MVKNIIFLILLIGVFQTNMPAQNNKTGNMKPFPEEICEINAKEDLLGKCVGNRVKLTGTMAKTILEPDLHYPDISSVGGYYHTNHIDTEWGQIGLISQKPIKCKKTIEVEGILRRTSLMDNKEKNDKPYIQVLLFNCK